MKLTITFIVLDHYLLWGIFKRNCFTSVPKAMELTDEKDAYKPGAGKTENGDLRICSIAHIKRKNRL